MNIVLHLLTLPVYPSGISDKKRMICIIRESLNNHITLLLNSVQCFFIFFEQNYVFNTTQVLNPFSFNLLPHILFVCLSWPVYPCPLVSVRFRESVFKETGHTIMNLLAVSATF